MVDLAEQAFQTRNFDLAVDIYERTIKENGPSSCLLLGLADSCAKTGQVVRALDAYKVALRLGTIKPEQLNHLVSSLVDVMGENKEVLKALEANEDDVFACGVCKSLVTDPVTIHCGHTFCRNCLEKENLQTCKQCDTVTKYGRNILQRKNNVVLQNIIEKWFSQELQAVRLKKKGNDFFRKQHMKDAITVYSEAMIFAPTDHLLPGNRSHAYAHLERFTEALKDAELAVKLRPDWAKGYFRKGTALSGLNKHEEACYAYLQCLILDPSVVSARSALAKSLHKVLSPLPPENLKQTQLQSSLLSSQLSSQLSKLVPTSERSSPQAQSDTASNKEGGVTRKTLSQLEISLRDYLGGADGGRKEDAQPSSVETLEDSISPLEPYKCPSLPTSAAASPLLVHRRSSSETDLQMLAHKLSRKRMCQGQKEPSSPTRVCPPKHARAESHQRPVPSALLERNDFECTLCYRMYHKPITTPCGHTFCKQCLDRCMDHSSTCPLCKSSLIEFIASRDQAETKMIADIIKQYFPKEFKERQIQFEEEMADLAKMGKDTEHEVPIFVCTLAFPKVPCPLHIFEPRYRLMIRQCMESGTRQFGMCVCLDEEEQNFSSIGTILEIRDVQYFPDGRSVVDTVGGRPFRVISRGRRDGYNTAQIELLTDTTLAQDEQQETLSLHNEILQEAKSWIDSLPQFRRARITEHYGTFPAVEQNPMSLTNGPAWSWWMIAVLPLDPRAQLTIIAMTSLKERLLSIRRVLVYFKKKQGH